ncbi:unnamed protein product [Owenia fusiformis]|uniref:Acyl-ACP thioesterase n=1 Tax=Owenia fusiformis TaxID=6347 RepID=A0A8S4N156_OWEFU|nr:unnamed protein product [Owenia fusiformis]
MAQVQRRLANMTRILNMPVKVDRNGTRAQVTIPGLSYDDFDRTGNLSVWKIARLVEISRAFKADFASIGTDLTKTFMVIGKQMAINPKFYVNANIGLSLTYVKALNYIGDGSIGCKVEIKDTKTDELYVECQDYFAYVDISARKAAKLPTQYKDKMKIWSTITPTYFLTPKRGEHCFTHKLNVTHSDMDVLYHTNQAAYVKYSMDCAEMARKENFYSLFKDDMGEYHAVSWDASYKGESEVGDQLEVVTWEDTTDANILHFEIDKNGKAIYFSTIKFNE